MSWNTQLVKLTNWITDPGSGQVRPYALAKGFKLHPIVGRSPLGLVLPKYIHLPGPSEWETGHPQLLWMTVFISFFYYLEMCPILSVLA